MVSVTGDSCRLECDYSLQGSLLAASIVRLLFEAAFAQEREEGQERQEEVEEGGIGQRRIRGGHLADFDQ